MVFLSSIISFLCLFGLNNVNGDLQEDCLNERCCKTRRDSTNDLCTSMTLQECVNNDETCYWNCDKEEDDLLFLGSRGHGKFVGFNNGQGKVHDYKPKDDDKNDESSDKTDPVLKMKSANDYVQYTSYRVFGKCGDVYEYNLPVSVAQSRLNKILKDKNSKDVSKDYYTNEKIDLDDILDEIEGQDIDDSERRRLDILGPDGRTQSTIKNTWPYRTVGKLVTSSGSCSATLISRRVILTAGHCVYDTESNNWLTNFKFYPDATSSSDIVVSNQYSGTSAMTFNGWISVTCCSGGACCGTAWDFDMGLVRLSVSDTGKGWMGWGYDNGLTAPQSLNTYGYPGDKPWGTKWTQYCDYNVFNTNTFGSNTCDVIGGQSGSGVYKYWPDTGNRIIYGVVSSGNSQSNTYCRITSSKFTTMCDFIDDGETSVC